MNIRIGGQRNRERKRSYGVILVQRGRERIEHTANGEIRLVRREKGA